MYSNTILLRRRRRGRRRRSITRNELIHTYVWCIQNIILFMFSLTMCFSLSFILFLFLSSAFQLNVHSHPQPLSQGRRGDDGRKNIIIREEKHSLISLCLSPPGPDGMPQCLPSLRWGGGMEGDGRMEEITVKAFNEFPKNSQLVAKILLPLPYSSESKWKGLTAKGNGRISSRIQETKRKQIKD